MAIQLESGVGGGAYRAGISARGRLHVDSAASSQEHEISHEDGRAYYANTADTANTLTITATGGPVLYIKNTDSTRELIIQKILASTDTAGTVMVLTKNPTLGTIGNANVHTPVNLNFASGNSAVGTFYNWASALKPFENDEDLLGVLRVHADSVVADRE